MHTWRPAVVPVQADFLTGRIQRLPPLPGLIAAVEYPGVRYMVIENFRPGQVGAIYRRLEESGRHMPAGLTYVGSWITDDLTRCYQVMECEEPALLDEWISHWADLMDFEVVPVISSSEAKAKALGTG